MFKEENSSNRKLYCYKVSLSVPQALSTAATVARFVPPSRNSPRYGYTQACLCKCVAFFTKQEPSVHIISVFLLHTAQLV